MDGNEAVKESQVLMQLNRAINALSTLSTLIDKLEDELAPICREEPKPELTQDQPKDTPTIEPLVARATTARGIVISINNCIVRIERLLETIEV